jgi:hypothetical protein
MDVRIEKGTGALLCRASEHFEGVYRVQPWSRGLHTEVNFDGQWQPVEIDLRLFGPWCELNPIVQFGTRMAQETREREDYHFGWHQLELDLPVNFGEQAHLEFKEPLDTSHREALLEFIKQVPSRAVELAKRFSFRQLQLLQVMHEGEWAAELLESFPTLAWLAVDARCRGAIDMPRDFWRLKRKEIIRHITHGAWGTAEMRLLEKVKVEDGSADELYCIRSFLGRPEVSLLRHFDSIDVIDMQHLREWPQVVDFSFAADALRMARSLCRGIERIRRCVEDSVRLGETLQLDPLPQIARCSTVREVYRLHDRWTAKLNQIRLEERLKGVTFPAPPFPGTNFIIPLDTPVALAQEGCEMRHCVGSYIDAVARGSRFVYRVMAPERATVMLRRRGGGWALDEIQCAANRPPSDATVRATREWLHASQPKAKGADKERAALMGHTEALRNDEQRQTRRRRQLREWRQRRQREEWTPNYPMARGDNYFTSDD